MYRGLMGCVGIIVIASGCGQAADDAPETAGASASEELRFSRKGAVFTQSNEAAENRVLAFARAANGKLEAPVAYATGGRGSGDGLGSQGALALTEDHQYLLAVNAGTNDVTSFEIDGAELKVRDRASSGGERPISVTVRNGLVYVLNAGGAGNVSGLRLDRRGHLWPLHGATRPLSGSGVGPAQVELSPDGDTLVVTEKTTSKIDTYRVTDSGRLDGPRVHDSAGTTPFGFEFTTSGYLVVSEAATASMSSYAVGGRRGFELLSGVVADTQRAPCWVTISADDRYAFTANAGSASISSYDIDRRGHITLKDPRAGETGEGSRPLDLAFGGSGRYLYALDAGHRGVASFSIHRGELAPLQTAGEMPSTVAGLAAY